MERELERLQSQVALSEGSQQIDATALTSRKLEHLQLYRELLPLVQYAKQLALTDLELNFAALDDTLHTRYRILLILWYPNRKIQFSVFFFINLLDISNQFTLDLYTCN